MSLLGTSEPLNKESTLIRATTLHLRMLVLLLLLTRELDEHTTVTMQPLH